MFNQAYSNTWMSFSCYGAVVPAVWLNESDESSLSVLYFCNTVSCLWGFLFTGTDKSHNFWLERSINRSCIFKNTFLIWFCIWYCWWNIWHIVFLIKAVEYSLRLDELVCVIKLKFNVLWPKKKVALNNFIAMLTNLSVLWAGYWVKGSYSRLEIQHYSSLGSVSNNVAKQNRIL